MVKIFSYLVAVCGGLLLFAALPSCSAGDNDEPRGVNDVYSACYSISGRVFEMVGEKKVSLEGIHVVMKPKNGVELDGGKDSAADTNVNGYFKVEVLSSNVKGDILILTFTDSTGRYDDKEVALQLQDIFEAENAEDGLFLGTYEDEIEVEMTLKGSTEKPAE